MCDEDSGGGAEAGMEVEEAEEIEPGGDVGYVDAAVGAGTAAAALEVDEGGLEGL